MKKKFNQHSIVIPVQKAQKNGKSKMIIIEKGKVIIRNFYKYKKILVNHIYIHKYENAKNRLTSFQIIFIPRF